MRRLFGTDGVRGVANRDLTPELAFKLGKAAAHVLLNGNGRMLVGRDTRISGTMLEAALVAGVTATGVDVELLGVVPTPAVACLTARRENAAGAMISASHNPIADNGIKFFDAEGYKLMDETEAEIEGYLKEAAATGIARPIGTGVGKAFSTTRAEEEYLDFLSRTVEERFDGLTVVVDCAYGATYRVAPRILEALGARVYTLHAEDDGSRINVDCGSTNPEELRRAVLENGAQVGLAHDGDGDRVIAVDEKGEVVDGDAIMTVCGLQMLAEGRLSRRTIAATVYSNLGLTETFKEAGGDVLVTDNGDRWVLAAMRKDGLNLGGEQSGHIIFLDHNTTGDGVLTALQLLGVLVRTGQPLSLLAGRLKRFPQLLQNVRVARKEGWEKNATVQKAITEARTRLGQKGRIFVRASGTEPLIRVMAEGPDRDVLASILAEVTGVIDRELV